MWPASTSDTCYKSEFFCYFTVQACTEICSSCSVSRQGCLLRLQLYIEVRVDPPPYSQPSIIMLRPCYVAHGYEKVGTDAELRLPVGWVVSLTVRSEGALEPDARRWEWGNSTTKIPWLLGLQVSMLWRNPLQGHAGPRIAQLVVCWARCPAWSSLVGSVLLRRILPVEVVVCWLLNVPATCKCISGMDLPR